MYFQNFSQLINPYVTRLYEKSGLIFFFLTIYKIWHEKIIECLYQHPN